MKFLPLESEALTVVIRYLGIVLFVTGYLLFLKQEILYGAINSIIGIALTFSNAEITIKEKELKAYDNTPTKRS